MSIDKAIFGLRFGSNEKIQPMPEELNALLDGANAADGKQRSAGDLAAFRQLIKDLTDFEHRTLQGSGRQDMRELMFYRVLGHSGFVNPGLLSAVEQYKFHLHVFLELDFKKPTSFVRSAEEEMGRLNMKRVDDVVRMARLQEMVSERKKVIAKLQVRGAEITSELRHIAQYIKDNLVRIEKRCEVSIAVLSDRNARGKLENKQIEDIKSFFKEQLRDALHHKQVTKEDLQKAREQVDVISEVLLTVIREDVNTLTTLYESIHDHVSKAAVEISFLLSSGGPGKGGVSIDRPEPFEQIGASLSRLVSAYRFELRSSQVHAEASHRQMIEEKRREMLDELFELVQKDRRARSDRRASRDRRKFSDAGYQGPERRTAKDRRAGRSRRE